MKIYQKLLFSGLVVAAVVTVVACGDGGSTTPTAVSASPAPAPAPATPVSPTPAPAAPIVVKVIGFNDYHGNLESPGTFGASTAVATADRPPVGGADYVAGRRSMFVCSGNLSPHPVSRGPVPETRTATALSADTIYERALAQVVQVLVA